MAEQEIELSGVFAGLNRSVSATQLSSSQSPDCTDCRNADRKPGALGPRLGRERASSFDDDVLGLGLLVLPSGRYKIVATADGVWTASAVTWDGITPPTPTTATVTGMDASAPVHFIQFRNRVYGFNGRNRPRAFNGNGWEFMGIEGGIDLPQFTPTIAYGSGGTVDVTTAQIVSNVATLTVAAHSFIAGQAVTVLLSDPQYNGSKIISATTSTTISYALTASDTGPTAVAGTITAASSATTPVLTMSVTSNVATITTSATYGFVTGQSVTFTGFYKGLVLVSPKTVTVTGSTTFTIPYTFPDISTFPIGSANPPVSLQTFVGITGASVHTSGITGSFYYMVAPTNSKRLDGNGRGIEGIPSMFSAEATPAGSGVVVGGIPTHSDPQVDYWNIYRTLDGEFDSGIVPEQQDFFYLARVPNGTATYTDVTSDESDWFVSGTSFNRLRYNQNIPPTAKYCVPYGDRLFAWGFDPIQTGTASVTGGMKAVSFADVELPDGVKGCYIKFDGEDVFYEIAKRPTTTSATLDANKVGTVSSVGYTIYRNQYEVWHSEFNDGDAWGPDGEKERFKKSLEGRKSVTACHPFEGSLLTFTVDEIYVITGKGPNRFDVKILPEPAYSGLGAVAANAVFRCDNEVHFLSLDGPAMVSSVGSFFEPQLYGAALNTDWLDALSSSELSLACAGTDGRACWYSVPVSGQTLNSKTFRYERDTKSWWEETEMCPKQFIRQDGTDGEISKLFYIQGAYIMAPARQPSALTTPQFAALDVLTQGLTGAPTTASNFFMDDTTAAFPNLEELYIRFYRSGSVIDTRRIISNTSTRISWSVNSALPGSGTMAGQTYDEYEIGPVVWYWTTKTVETPGHLQHVQELRVTFEPI